MNNKSFSKDFNNLIGILAIFNAYFSIIPHFTKSIINVDHKILVIVIGYYFLQFIIKTKFINNKNIEYILIFVIISGLFVSFHATFSIEYYTKWILFAISILLYIMCLNNTAQMSDSTLILVFIFNILPMIFYILESFDSTYYLNTRIGSKLLLTFQNENSTAMQLLLIECVFLLFARLYIDQCKRFYVIICFVMIFANTYLIFLTKSRSSLLAVIFLLIFYIFERFDFLINRITILMVILFPLIFAIIFTLLYRANYHSIIILGRNLFNGREIMWDSVFHQPLLNLLFGSYHVYTIGTGKLPFQLHNGIVDMIASYGIIITGCFLYIIYNVLILIHNQKNKMGFFILICCLALMIQNCGEAALIIGSRCNFICMLFLFLHVNKLNNKKVNLI